MMKWSPFSKAPEKQSALMKSVMIPLLSWAAVVLFLAVMLTAVSGCARARDVSRSDLDRSETPAAESENTPSAESETAGEAEYKPSVYYDYWNTHLIPKYGTCKQVRLKEADISDPLVTGSAGVCICDADSDGQDEMRYVYIGKYGSSRDSMVLEVYEFVKGKVKKTASAVINEHCAFYGNGSASVFLSRKGNQRYICSEEFGDHLGEARTTEYLILTYNGQSLKHCKSIFDPGYTSETALYADTSGKSFAADKNGVKVFQTGYKGWETLYAENYEKQGQYIKDKKVYVTGRYTDYQKALESELSEYGLSLRFSEGFNKGARLDVKTVTRICRHLITCSEKDGSVTCKAILCDDTGSLFHIAKSSAKALKLDSDRQYHLNIYLSNFSEVELDAFDGLPDTEELIRFGIFHNIKNNGKTVDDHVSDEYIYRMSTKHIADKIYKYFFVRTEESEFQAYGKNDYWMDYKKGYLYSADPPEGAVWGSLTVVSKVESIGDDLYKVTFAQYDLDSYYGAFPSDRTVNYHLTTAEVKKAGLHKTCAGTAVIYASDLKKRGTYQLMGYHWEE